MTPATASIARRLSLHPAWRWMDGANALRWAPGFRDHLTVGYRVDENLRRSGFIGELVPDLDDAATIGTVEEQVRAVIPQAVLWPPENTGESWVINFGILDHLAEGATRGEAWVNAFLEWHK